MFDMSNPLSNDTIERLRDKFGREVRDEQRQREERRKKRERERTEEMERTNGES